jgi:hypothetical protein
LHVEGYVNKLVVVVGADRASRDNEGLFVLLARKGMHYAQLVVVYRCTCAEMATVGVSSCCVDDWLETRAANKETKCASSCWAFYLQGVSTANISSNNCSSPRNPSEAAPALPLLGAGTATFTSAEQPAGGWSVQQIPPDRGNNAEAMELGPLLKRKLDDEAQVENSIVENRSMKRSQSPVASVSVLDHVSRDPNDIHA